MKFEKGLFFLQDTRNTNMAQIIFIQYEIAQNINLQQLRKSYLIHLQFKKHLVLLM